MTKFNEAILEAAGQYLGLTEWPGAKQNPKIIEMFDLLGHSGVKNDETPWCAAFVGSVLSSLGLPHTGKLNARSYLTYGQSIRAQEARPGDIVILWRDSPESWMGHVGFFVRFEGNSVVLRGGNQGNAVTDQAYPMDRVLAVRRADGVTSSGKRPVLRAGDRGVFVVDLQKQLTELGYTLGRLDGVFGSRTLAAVVAFQHDNHLVADGIVGDRTWIQLSNAEQRPERPVTAADLGESRTIKAAESGKNITALTATVGAAGAAVSAAEQAVAVAEQANTIMEKVMAVGPWVMIALAIGVGGYLLWQKFNRIKELRVEDAKTGVNDRR